MAELNISLATGGREAPTPIRIRRQAGSRSVFDNSGQNGFFSISPSRIVGTRPVYVDLNVARKVIASIDSMGASAKRGCAMAANRAAEKVARRFIGIAKRDLNTDGAEADRAISVTAIATESNPSARVTVKEFPLPLIRFSPVETDSGVMAITDRSRAPRQIDDGFIATGRDGSLTAFVREGNRRYPLDELYGPSVRQFIADRLPQERPWITAILFDELRRATDKVINENFGFDTLSPLDSAVQQFTR
jgi:hypothetical protein